MKKDFLKNAYLYACILLTYLLLNSALFAKDAREIEWDDLVPEGYFESIEKKQESTIGNMFDGFGDALGFDGADDNTEESLKAYEELQVSLRSAPIVPELDGEYVKLSGFIVPLDFDFDNGTFNQLLLAPYFGACIHVPPPPSNQIIYIKSAEPLKEEILNDAITITGTITTKSVDSEYGAAGYSMEDVLVEAYEEVD